MYLPFIMCEGDWNSVECPLEIVATQNSISGMSIRTDMISPTMDHRVWDYVIDAGIIRGA